MKKTLMLMLLAVVFTGVSSAVTITCASGLSVNPGNPVINCGPLIFDNFQVLNVSGGASGRFDINVVTFDDVTGQVIINGNPNLGSNQHFDLFFRVRGGIDSIDLSVGGTNGTVTERACLNPIPTGGPLANLCTNAAGTMSVPPLGQVTVHSGDVGQPFVAPFVITTPVYIFKDIATGVGGGMSTMNQSFHSVPEPVSMLLLGSGLLAFGIIRKRRRK